MVLRDSKLKILGLILILVELTGCANNTLLYNPPAQTMSFEDLNYYKYDCQHAAEQMVFLQHQLKNISIYDINNPNRAIIYQIMGQLRNDCGYQENRAVGCVHVREDMTSGVAEATVCNANDKGGMRPLERPIVNRWDALVDN
jgi:hypothetical protein